METSKLGEGPKETEANIYIVRDIQKFTYLWRYLEGEREKLWKAYYWLKIITEKSEKHLIQNNKQTIIKSHKVLLRSSPTFILNADTKKIRELSDKDYVKFRSLRKLGAEPEMYCSLPMKNTEAATRVVL